jgi:Leucine-rich repeat (LRR) protein
VRQSARYGGKTGILVLNGLKLESVPESLREIRNLDVLALTYNRLRELPEWIAELSSLKAIGLGKNQLRTVPPEIGSLPELTHLYLDDNKLDASRNASRLTTQKAGLARKPEVAHTRERTGETSRGNPKILFRVSRPERQTAS